MNTDLQIATSSEVNPNTHLDPVLSLVNSLQSDNDRPISSSFESNTFSVPASRCSACDDLVSFLNVVLPEYIEFPFDINYVYPNVDATHNIASKFETTVKRLPDVNMSKNGDGQYRSDSF